MSFIRRFNEKCDIKFYILHREKLSWNSLVDLNFRYENEMKNVIDQSYTVNFRL